MYLKGFKVNRARHIGMRNSKLGDLDSNGDQIKGSVVFVNISDCRIYEDERGIKRYDSSEAPAIPVAYGGTYYGYGAPRFNKKMRRFQSKLYYEYWTRPVYFAHDGMVYMGTVYMFDTPNDWPMEIEVGRVRSLVSILREALPYFQEQQKSETIVGRVQHVQNLIKYLDGKLEQLQPEFYEDTFEEDTESAR